MCGAELTRVSTSCSNDLTFESLGILIQPVDVLPGDQEAAGAIYFGAMELRQFTRGRAFESHLGNLFIIGTMNFVLASMLRLTNGKVPVYGMNNREDAISLKMNFQ